MSDDVTTLRAQRTAGELFAGRYKIIAELGRGGMGAVYKALDTELRDTAVALKLINPLLAEDVMAFERFRSEVLIARSLSHPNIARTYDLGRAPDGTYYITMELIEGPSLAAKLKGPAPLELPQMLRILREILLATGYAHDHGIVHRDLKPANVLLTATGEVKLVDFGTAHLMGADGLTRAGEILGTPGYMAPEQISSGEIDNRTDLYSIAIIAFELAEGRRPFQAPSVMGVLAQQSTSPLPKLQRRDLPHSFVRAVSKGAEKSKDKRFNSAAEFLEALTEASVAREQSPLPAQGPPLRLVLGAALGALLLVLSLRAAPFLGGAQRQVPQVFPTVTAATELTRDSKPAPAARPASENLETASAPHAAAAATLSAATVERAQVTERVEQVTPPEKSPSSSTQISVRPLLTEEWKTVFTVEELRTARVIVTIREREADEKELYCSLRSSSGEELERLPLHSVQTVPGDFRFRTNFNEGHGGPVKPGRYVLEVLSGAEKLGSETLVVTP